MDKQNEQFHKFITSGDLDNLKKLIDSGFKVPIDDLKLKNLFMIERTPIVDPMIDWLVKNGHVPDFKVVSWYARQYHHNQIFA